MINIQTIIKRVNDNINEVNDILSGDFIELDTLIDKWNIFKFEFLPLYDDLNLDDKKRWNEKVKNFEYELQMNYLYLPLLTYKFKEIRVCLNEIICNHLRRKEKEKYFKMIEFLMKKFLI